MPERQDNGGAASKLVYVFAAMILVQIGSSYMNQASKETEELKTTEQQDRAPGHRPYEDNHAALGILDQD